MRTKAGERFKTTIRLTKQDVADFARVAGDLNPLHYDEAYARSSPFGGLIASGPHTTALLMGCSAGHFASGGPMVGLEFSFRFRCAVPADDLITLEWLVIRVRYSEILRGDLVEMRGRVVRSDGHTAVGATGKVLLK